MSDVDRLGIADSAGVVIAALARAQARPETRLRFFRRQRLREAVERAIELLTDLGQHAAAQELIARLDDLDGNPDLEDDNEDCCPAYDDWGGDPRMSSCFQIHPDPYEAEEGCHVPHVDDQRRWTGTRFYDFDSDEKPPRRRKAPEPRVTPKSKYPFREIAEITVTGTGRRQWAIVVVHESWSMFTEFFDTLAAAEKRLADWGDTWGVQ
jgi:hypothetical protein